MRGKGEGSIYQRKDGRWCATLTLPGSRKALYGATRAEVVTKLREARRLYERNRALPDDRITVAKYLDNWLLGVQPTLRERTWIRYRQFIRRHATPALGHMKLAKLEPEHLQRLYNSMLQQGLSPTTVRQLHAIIHSALRQAERWGLIARNVAALVDPPRRNRPEMKVLNTDEARRFLQAARDTNREALFVLAVTTGMRQGELLGLRWRNVDLDTGRLSVVASLQRANGKAALLEPKTPRSRRQVGLATIAVSALQKHRQRQSRDRLAAGELWVDRDLVFPNQLGGPLDAHNMVQRDFYSLLRRAGLPRIRFHDLRHTAATLMLGQGIHPKVVAEMLGHSTVAVTLDVYSHVTMTLQADAASQLDALLRRKPLTRGR